jgi:hypothetical protein
LKLKIELKINICKLSQTAKLSFSKLFERTSFKVNVSRVKTFWSQYCHVVSWLQGYYKYSEIGSMQGDIPSFIILFMIWFCHLLYFNCGKVLVQSNCDDSHLATLIDIATYLDCRWDHPQCDHSNWLAD